MEEEGRISIVFPDEDDDRGGDGGVIGRSECTARKRSLPRKDDDVDDDE